MTLKADLDEIFGLQTLQSAFEEGDPIAIQALLLRASANLRSECRGDDYVRSRLAGLARILIDELAQNRVPIADVSRAHLIVTLAPFGIDAVGMDDVKRISALLHGVDIGGHLDQLDQSIKDEFYQEIAVSKLVDDASIEWETPEWTPERKIAYGQHVADVFCEVLGMPKMVVKGVRMPAAKEEGQRPVMGYCAQRRDGTTVIGINIDAAVEDYEEFHATLHHEIMHGIHLYLGDLVKNGQSQEIPKEYLPVAVLLMAMMDRRVYEYSTRSQDLYLAFGVEEHAERNALDFAQTMQDIDKRYQLAKKAGFKSRLVPQGV